MVLAGVILLMTGSLKWLANHFLMARTLTGYAVIPLTKFKQSPKKGRKDSVI